LLLAALDEAYATLKFAAGQHDQPATAFALQANIRAQAVDAPAIRAAGVGFLERQEVVIVEVEGHGVILVMV
jgi:hypothetical protein